MSVERIYDQPHEVENRSIPLMNLVEAVVIVIIALLSMGFRSGILIGGVLLLTVLGTFIFANIFDINLQRVSSGALIIALGMLVDNAIVIADGMIAGMQRTNLLKAAATVVRQNQWPLLGATVIGIIAFAPIGISTRRGTCWKPVLGVVDFVTTQLDNRANTYPLLADRMYKEGDKSAADGDDVYGHPV